jgi:hypothetical protein
MRRAHAGSGGVSPQVGRLHAARETRALRDGAMRWTRKARGPITGDEGLALDLPEDPA